MGLVIYIILPSFLIVGLLLIPIGMYRTHKRMAKMSPDEMKRLPHFDLNDPRHRNAFSIFSFGTIIFLFLSAIGSYEAFNFTETTEFCGETCHTVMTPEYTAYKTSPHARVKCVECHVGEGADWYVKSKLSGLYQVYAVIAGVYPKPIPTPINNLRPARETCEKCHWPQKFYARKLDMRKHFLSDESNTEWNIFLTTKIGAEHSSKGLTEGIHWHINPNVKVEYISVDKNNQDIPWVRYIDIVNNDTVVYRDEESEADDSLLASSEIHEMDCIDCHNRPSHIYNPPAIFVNHAMSIGAIPTSLPEIKSLSMEICEEDFNTTDSAMTFIRDKVNSFYEENYPDLVEEKPELILKGIQGLQEAYRKNIFPEMRVKWNAYPNNIGHLEFKGCFRCHSYNHVSENGGNISHDCNGCHLITAQGIPEETEVAGFNGSLEFKHPTDIDQAWKESFCTECHTGLNP